MPINFDLFHSGLNANSLSHAKVLYFIRLWFTTVFKVFFLSSSMVCPIIRIISISDQVQEILSVNVNIFE